MDSSSGSSSYRAHVEKAPVGIFEIDEHGEYVDINELGCEMSGYPRAELLERSVADLTPEREDTEEIPWFAELRETGRVQTDGQISHNDGHTVDVLLEGIEIEDGRFVVYTRDISEKKENREVPETTREELRQVIDRIPDPIFVKDRDDKVLLSNEANAELHGLTPDEIEGVRERDIEPDIEDMPDSDKYREREKTAIETGEPITYEENLTSANGTHHIFRTTRIPFEMRRSDGDTVLVYAHDITELKEYEKELENQRDNLEILNGVLRHDIRNDLQQVTAYADLLINECDDESMCKYISMIQSSADHAVELTDTARELADAMVSVTQDSQAVNLRAVLEKEVSEVQSSYPNAAVTYETTIPDIVVNANDMLASVFRNLLKNAIQHNDKSVAAVEVSATDRDDTVTVRVADNGPGVPDDQKEVIFGRAERGLESAGTGIGLYLVETLVTDYGGEVSVKDNQPEGAVFIVELPKAT